MKILKIIHFSLLLLVLYSPYPIQALAADQLSAEASKEIGQLPADWFQTPEQSASEKSLASSPIFEQLMLKQAGKTFERVLSEQQKALDSNNREIDHGWFLTFVVGNLAITQTGVLGVLTGRGTPSFGLYWRRKGIATIRNITPPLLLPGPKVPVLPSSPSSASSIVISEETSASDLDKQLEPVMKSLVKTGKIKDPLALKSHLFHKALEFQNLFKLTVYDPQKFPYYIQQLILEFQVTAGGTVSPIFSVDGIFRLRFEWSPMVKRSPLTDPHPTILGSEDTHPTPSLPPASGPVPPPPVVSSLQKNFMKFINSMTKSLHEGVGEIAFDPDFPLNLVQVRFGIGANETFFVARSSQTTIGQITFRRLPPTRALVVPDNKDDDSEIIIGDVSKSEDLTAAKSLNIPYTTQPLSSHTIKALNLVEGAELVLYHAPRANFINGLKKAMRMARFFTQRAKKIPSRHFQLFRIYPGLQISLGGKISMTTVTGTAAIFLAFDRPK